MASGESQQDTMETESDLTATSSFPVVSEPSAEASMEAVIGSSVEMTETDVSTLQGGEKLMDLQKSDEVTGGEILASGSASSVDMTDQSCIERGCENVHVTEDVLHDRKIAEGHCKNDQIVTADNIPVSSQDSGNDELTITSEQSKTVDSCPKKKEVVETSCETQITVDPAAKQSTADVDTHVSIKAESSDELHKDNSPKQLPRIRKLRSPSADEGDTEKKDHEQLQWVNEPFLGFSFDEKGELRDRNGERFVFDIYPDHYKNQDRYVQLGEAITEKIYKLLEDQCKLRRVYLPIGVDTDDKHDHQMPPDAKTSTKDCLTKLDKTADEKKCDKADSPSGPADPEQVGVSVKQGLEASAIHEPTEQGHEVETHISTLKDKPHSFIFVSDNWKTCDRLLILIHGSGVVRAGQWARRLIVNEDLEKGTQIPYIERACREGYGVVVLNTNLNRWPDGERSYNSRSIPHNGSPEEHATYVWDELIMKCCAAKHIAIVAHSYGGIVVQHLVTEKLNECMDKVFAVAFTDSVHGFHYRKMNEDHGVIKFFKERVRNWVTSDLELDEPVSIPSNDAPRVSAGHTKHEWTSFSSFDSVFKFLDEQYQKRISSPENSAADATTASDELPESHL